MEEMDGENRKIENYDLRSVWKHEEYDFSKWLAQEKTLSNLVMKLVLILF